MLLFASLSTPYRSTLTSLPNQLQIFLSILSIYLSIYLCIFLSNSCPPCYNKVCLEFRQVLAGVVIINEFMYATSLFCPENTVSLKLVYTNPYPHCGTPIYNDHGTEKYVHWCKSALNVMGIINYFLIESKAYFMKLIPYLT